MRQIIKLCLFMMASLISFEIMAIDPIPVPKSDLSNISVEHFLGMKYKTYKSITGEKGLAKRLRFLSMKKYLKIRINQGHDALGDDYKPASDRFDFRWGAFLLGVFLSVLGLIFVILIYDKPRKSAVISWLIGFLVGGVGFGISLG